MLDGVVVSVSAELAYDLFIRSAHSVTLGISALDHKAGDDSVEYESVIESLAYKLFKILYCNGGSLGIKVDLDHAAVFQFDYNHILLLLV